MYTESHFGDDHIRTIAEAKTENHMNTTECTGVDGGYLYSVSSVFAFKIPKYA